jgi:chromosome segregation ATPase
MSNTDTQKTSDTSSAANGRVGSGDSSASDTPRTEALLVLCNHGEYRVPADFARQLERELFAFKRSNERIIRDHNDRLAELRYAENMQRAAESETERVRKAALDQWAELRKTIHSLEADVVALTARSKHLEEQRNMLNETCQTLRAQTAGLTHMRTMKIAGLGEMVELITSQANWDSIRDTLSSPNS